jgi:pSer/pThr/pTyr-binding forkhead associated (FHA) protein
MFSVLWRRTNRLRGVLQIEGGPENGKELRVRQLPLTIGRGEEADFPLEDRWVSRRHCEIFERDGALALRDLGSRHGTLVNGHVVSESVLQPGDRISIGMTTLVARCELRIAGRG